MAEAEKEGWGDQETPREAAAASTTAAAPTPPTLAAPKSFLKWDEAEVMTWLVAKGAQFEQYRAKFAENNVSGEFLADLAGDDASLREVGMDKAIHRKQFKKYVDALVAGEDAGILQIDTGAAPDATAAVPAEGKKTPREKKKGPVVEAVVETAEEMMQRLEIQKKLEDQKNEIWKVLQADPNSELVAAQTWEELKLKPGLLEAVYDMRFQKPSKIQEHALPLGLKDPPENGIYQARSGHGKTCAFSLIMLMRIDETKEATQALCLAPTYELALQTKKVCQQLGSKMGATTQLAVADNSCHFNKGDKCTKHIVIGTPGKVNTLLKMGVINAKTIKVFVLDEADLMVEEDGHREMTLKIKKLVGAQAQTLLFSASFEDKTYEFAKKLCKKKGPDGKAMNYNEIKIQDVTNVMLEEISQFYIKTDGGDKMEALENVYSSLTVGQSIIFVERKTTADELQRYMESRNLRCCTLHGGIDKEYRKLIYEEFKDQKRKVLIATNAMARGIDVPGMTLVVNYDFPVKQDGNTDFETYQHRIGRCGRFGRKGCAFSFIHTADDQRHLDETTEHFKCEVLEAPMDDAESLEELVKAAQKISK